MKNLVREKILNGEKAFGTFHELGSSSAIEVIGYAGVDYIVIDGEHGPFEPERVQEFVRASKSGNITPFVRVKDSEKFYIEDVRCGSTRAYYTKYTYRWRS